MGRPDRPLDPAAGPLAAFAAGLRDLRRQAGNPTYRTLAEQAHYSATTLSDAAGGRKLPTLPVVLALVRACGGDVEAWRARWQEVADALKADADDAVDDDGTDVAAVLATAAPAVLALIEPTAAPASAPAPAPASAPVDDTQTPATVRSEPPASTRGRRAMWARVAAVPLAVAAVIAGVAVLDHGKNGHSAAPAVSRGALAATASTRAAGGSPDATASARPTAVGSADPTITTPANPVASSGSSTHAVATEKGGSTATTPAAVTVSWSAYSGPSCASSGAAAISFYSSHAASAPWHTTAVSCPTGYGGCADPRYTHLSGNATSSDNDADWVFKPGSAVTACRFQIYVPQGTWAGSVMYEVLPGDASNGYQGSAIASFTVDQAADDGGGWASSPQVSFSTGIIDLQITDEGATPQPGAAADVVKATCT